MRKLLFILLSFLPSFFVQAQDHVAKDLKKSLNGLSPSLDRLNTPIEFHITPEEYNRYKNSPCFSLLGYIPGRDNEVLYVKCESEKADKKTKRILLIMFVVLAWGGVVASFFYFNKTQNK